MVAHGSHIAIGSTIRLKKGLGGELVAADGYSVEAAQFEQQHHSSSSRQQAQGQDLPLE
jgi:hypothetical protein